MSHSLSLADLKDNLVPFPASQVKTSLIWCAPDVNDKEALRSACSYLIAPGSSAPARTFHAERYGGSGIQRNGGGARCGFDGHYQVKGIGANPLVGEGSDQCHSNGALSACQAIYEALWSEVLAETLPHGAVRTRAVLLIENDADTATEKIDNASRRALLVREPVIRPAHFERAPWFRPKPEFDTQLMHDAQRVKSVIRMLPASLPSPPAGFSDEAGRDLPLYCIEGLGELARRLARQMAFCRTHFLRLTTSPSNIAIDGRLMDFNGLSSLFPGDYRYDFSYQLRLKEFNKEPAVLQQGLSDLCLYLGKYLFDPAFTKTSRRQIQNTFQQTFQDACYRGYLDLLGLPTAILPLNALPAVLKQLVDSFIKLFDNLCQTFYCPHPDEENLSPLERVVVALIRCGQGQTVKGSEDLQKNVHFRQTAGCYTNAVHWLVLTCREKGINPPGILDGMERQSRQRLQPRRFLNKERMFEEIENLLNSHGNDPLCLQQAISSIQMHMQTFARVALVNQQPLPAVS